ncbi:MAG: PKD domain-containing protein, partial [Bacteroidota bacterium]
MSNNRQYPSPCAALFTLLLICLCCTSGRAQICPDNACGNLTVGFTATGSAVVFCEGSTITLENTSVAGFDFFIIDWQDGQIDTVFNYNDVSHRYTFPEPDENACNAPASFNVSFQGIAECAAGRSCQPGSLGFSVMPRPIARMQVPTEVCSGRPLNFRSSTSCNAETFRWDFGDGNISTDPNPSHTYGAPGSYTVSLEVTGIGECASVTDRVSRQIDIVTPPDAVFVSSDDDLVACRGSEITFTNQSNDDTNIEWTISPGSGWEFIDTMMNERSEVITIRFLQSRDYTINLRGFNACDSEESEQVITIEDAPTIRLEDPPPSCESVTLTPADLNYRVDGNTTSICWEFTGGNGTNTCTEDFGSVTYTSSGSVRLIVESLCGMIERTANVVVQSGEVPMLTTQPEYCTGSAIDTFRTSSPGGTWSGPGIVSASLGTFNPAAAGAGTHTIRYAITDGPCQNENTIMVEVVASETVTVTDETICIDDAAISLSAIPSGGTWSGTGITDGAVGTFDPGVSGVGDFQPTYDYLDPNGCAVTARPTVTVVALPTVSTVDTALVCLVDETISLAGITSATPSPAGGTFVWIVNGTPISGDNFNPTTDLPGVGTYLLEYAYALSPCEITGTTQLQVIENPVLALTQQDNVCISEGTLTLAANLSGGEWSGPGINPITGEINLASAGGGDRTYTYVFQPGGSCEQQMSQTVTIEDPGATIDAGTTQAVCEAEVLTVTLTGASPAGGRWSGPGITDPVAGTVDLTSLMAGQDYEYTYAIESATTPGCAAEDRKTLRYNARPNPNFMVDGAPCINQEFGLSAGQTGSGFTYRWDFGDGTTSSQPEPRHTYTTGGTFTQSLQVTSPAGCAADTSATIYVTTPPAPAFTLDSLEGCAPFVLDLADQSTGDDFTTTWRVNGQTFPGGQNLNYVIDSFFTDTVIEVRLEATNFCGARAQVQSVLVKPYPTVIFGLATDDGCSPFTPEINNVTRGMP